MGFFSPFTRFSCQLNIEFINCINKNCEARNLSIKLFTELYKINYRVALLARNTLFTLSVSRHRIVCARQSAACKCTEMYTVLTPHCSGWHCIYTPLKAYVCASAWWLPTSAATVRNFSQNPLMLVNWFFFVIVIRVSMFVFCGLTTNENSKFMISFSIHRHCILHKYRITHDFLQLD